MHEDINVYFDRILNTLVHVLIHLNFNKYELMHFIHMLITIIYESCRFNSYKFLHLGKRSRTFSTRSFDCSIDVYISEKLEINSVKSELEDFILRSIFVFER